VTTARPQPAVVYFSKFEVVYFSKFIDKPWSLLACLSRKASMDRSHTRSGSEGKGHHRIAKVLDLAAAGAPR
jgi:hypothetical protein